MASCITPIPIPAIPKPLTRYMENKNHGLDTIPELMITMGAINSVSINTVFTTMLLFPYLLRLASWKYAFTLLLNIVEKSVSFILLKLRFLIVHAFK